MNLARPFPAGIQLLNTLLPSDAESSATAISSISGLVDGALLFVWNGSDVNGVLLPQEAFIEPVVLELQTQRLDDQGCPYQASFHHSFPKSMLLCELRFQLPSIINKSRFVSGSERTNSAPLPPELETLPADASIARVRAKGRDARAEGGADARHIAYDTLLLDHQHDDKTFLELGKLLTDANEGKKREKGLPTLLSEHFEGLVDQ